MEAIAGSRIRPQMSLNLNSKSLHHHVKFIPSFLSTSKLTVDRRSKNSVSVKRKSSSGKMFCSNGSFASESQVAEEKIGILLLNLGAPDTYDDVQPFLFNMFSDPDIIRLPRYLHFLQRPLAWLLSTLRAPKSKEAYASISGGSPLKKMTNEQAYVLELALSDLEFPVNVYVAMRYWHPFTEEAVHQIKRDNITRLVVLPLYPQYSISTTGSSVRVLHEMFRDDAHLSRLPVAIIQSWSHRDDYISCFVNSISDTLQYFSNPDEVTIFFTAHGVPMNYVDNAGDPYRDQVEECVSLIMEELNGNGHTLAYQSLVGPLQWLKPSVDEVLVELSQQGVKSILSVPVSFVSEHIETLEEVRNEYYDLAYELGITDWGGVGYQHNISSFAITLANAVIEALPSAMPISNSNSSSSATSTYKSEKDNVGYGIKMIFGSIFAFLPKVVSAFTNRVL